VKVLYATDGSLAAVGAKEIMSKLFSRRVEVTIASVTHSWSLAPDHLLVQLDPIDERRNDSISIVAAAAAEIEEAGFVVKTQVLEGHPGHEIVKAAREGDHDVILVGAGSHRWLDNRLLGSVSNYVLHEADRSVLVVHEVSARPGRGLVLVGVDGSPASFATVDLLVRLLDPDVCDIEVLSVVSLPVPAAIGTPMLVGAYVPSSELLGRERETLRERSETYTAQAVGAFRVAGFDVTSRVIEGAPSLALLEEARSMRADLVAVGSRGVGSIRRALLGSVSDQTARHASAALVGRSGA
jgi:nucleotide-binding universal stress UspA family protein